MTRKMEEVKLTDLMEWFSHGYMCGRLLSDADPDTGLYTQWQWENWAAGNRTGRFDHDLSDFNPTWPTTPLIDANPDLKRRALAHARAYMMGFRDGHDNRSVDDTKWPVLFINTDLLDIWKSRYRLGWQIGVKMQELDLYTVRVHHLIIPTPTVIRPPRPIGPARRRMLAEEKWWREATTEGIHAKLRAMSWENVPGVWFNLYRELKHEDTVEYLKAELVKAHKKMAREPKWLTELNERIVQSLETRLRKETGNG